MREDSKRAPSEFEARFAAYTEAFERANEAIAARLAASGVKASQIGEAGE